MKKVIYLFVGILALLFVVSCDTNEEPVVVDPVAELIEVSFDVNDFIPDFAAKGTPKDGVPECDDTAVPVTATVTLDETEYDLNLISISGSYETEVLKLAEAVYSVTAFVLKDVNGDVTHAATNTSSAYGQAWGPDGDNTIVSLPIDIDVEGFTKKKFTLSVLCYQPYDYERFGFAWFEYAKYEIKTLCFFGDVCSKFWETWNAEGSAYAGTITGYDFRAGFTVTLWNGSTQITTGNDNTYPPQGLMDEDNNIIPLCVEYPHMVGSTDTLTFVISLLQPDGTYDVIHSENFNSGDMSMIGDEDAFGGADGVFDFVVGNCTSDDADALINDVELPAWIPGVGDTVTIDINQPTLKSYLNMTVSGVIGEFAAGSTLPAWCGTQDYTITYKSYSAKLYSSLDPASMPQKYKDYGARWNVLNWVVNNYDLLDRDAEPNMLNIQQAIWNLIHDTTVASETALFDSMKAAPGSFNLSNITNADILTYVPPVGGYAVVFADPVNDNGTPAQIMIVRVDP